MDSFIACLEQGFLFILPSSFKELVEKSNLGYVLEEYKTLEEAVKRFPTAVFYEEAVLLSMYKRGFNTVYDYNGLIVHEKTPSENLIQTFYTLEDYFGANTKVCFVLKWRELIGDKIIWAN
jgi:hypothetical protein